MLAKRKVSLYFRSLEDAAYALGLGRSLILAANEQPIIVNFESVADAARAISVTRAGIHNAVSSGYRVRNAEVRMGAVGKGRRSATGKSKPRKK